MSVFIKIVTVFSPPPSKSRSKRCSFAAGSFFFLGSLLKPPSNRCYDSPVNHRRLSVRLKRRDYSAALKMRRRCRSCVHVCVCLQIADERACYISADVECEKLLLTLPLFTARCVSPELPRRPTAPQLAALMSPRVAQLPVMSLL